MTSVLEERAYWLKRCLLLEQQLQQLREERDAAREVAALYRHKLWQERGKRRKDDQHEIPNQWGD